MNEETTEKTDQTKEERDSLNEMTKGSSFSERFATFFRLNKSYIDNKATTAADETTEDADQKNVPEVVVTSTDGDTNKATDAGDNDEEEQPMVDDGEAEK